MKKKNKSKKKILYLLIIIISIYLSYKYLENKKIELSNKEFVNMIVNNTFKEESILKKIVYKPNNSIKLLNDSYKEVIEKKKSNDPIIYLYNSHPTEEYRSTTIEDYSISPTVIMNNYILKELFEKEGFYTYVEEESVTNILNNNNWNYASSYKASRMLLEDAKITYPSLKYFIDIHRDSLSKDKTTINIEGKDYAKIIFLLGLENEKYEENLSFIEKINNKLDTKYPGLSKGIYKKGGIGVNGVYNQDFSNKTILIEIGGYENNTIEVFNTVIAFTDCFLEVLNEENS